TEPTARLDIRDTAQLKHLTEDALIAEELAIRYSDSFGPRGGCLHCAGHVRTPRPQILEIRRACEATLTARIGDIHGIGPDEVRLALERRDVRVDVAAVILPMALLLALIANVVAGWVYRHVADGNSAAIILAAFVAL